LAVEIINLQIGNDEAVAFIGDVHHDSNTPSSRIDNFPVTVCYKLNDIREKCVEAKVKAAIILGDVFNRVVMPNDAINQIGKELLKFRESGIQVFAIVGNHDISRNKIDTIEKAPLSILFNFGVLEHIHLNKRIILNKRTLLTPLDYTDDLVPAQKGAKHNILLAHRFYNDEYADPKHNLTNDDLTELGYDCAILGHDHVPYPIMNGGNTDIVRPGSVTRGTAHNYQFERSVGFYILKNPAEYSVGNFKYIDIDARPFKEVISSIVQNKKFSLADLGGLMNDLVDRLASKDMDGSVGIYEQVMSDKDLDPNVRQLLLRYFTDSCIMS
jgi:DNA repair exonuclease SbcCD nuclease subunit